MKVLFVLGTRPEAIKCAPVIKTLAARHDIETRVCVTGQHRHVLDQVLEIFDIVPDHDLAIMEPQQTLPRLTCKAIEGVTRVLEETRPDRVVVQGDTTTAFCAGLAAFYQRIPVSHIEAGLRTNNLLSPYPEEANRKLLSVIADQHFAPTAGAAANLTREGIAGDRILITGNTVIDAVRMSVPLVGRKAEIDPALARGLRLHKDKKTVLLTTHRRENWGDGIRQIAEIAAHVAQRGDAAIYLPVHPNPKVRTPIQERLGREPNVVLLDPLDYLSFIHLMTKSYVILTDSGGVQEEAAAIGCPVFVLRDTTERPEGVAGGIAQLVGVTEQQVMPHVNRLLDDRALRDSLAKPSDIYGDGRASERIADWLVKKPN